MSEALFGQYRLFELLGRGGMGEVYRAFHTEQERIVALKLLLPELSGDDVYRIRFLRESRLAARLTDPHVIPVHSWGEVDGRLYIDMRFIAGEDLAARLGRRGAMPPAAAVDVVGQVAGALDAAHVVELVHRDVKPSNVLLAGSDDSAADFAYLADFGIARLTHSSGEGASTTGAAPVGTLAYMAPERFLDAPVDRRVDVYALACVLYECLTGRRPFEVSEPIAAISAHLHAEPPRPSRQDSRIPPALDDVVAVGMAKDPAVRYPSAGALAAAARDALRNSPMGAPTATGVGVVPPPVRPRPPAGGPLPGPSRPPSGRRTGLLAAAAAVLVAAAAAGVLLTVRAAPPVPTPPPVSTPVTPSPTPDPGLSPADRALLVALPPGFTAANCGPDPAPPATATAALRCGAGPAGGPDAAEFARFVDVDALDRFVADDARQRRLPLDTGSCRDGGALQTTWSKNGQIAGLLSCYSDPTTGRTLRWTDRAAVAMGVVSRTDGDSSALYDWWTRYDIAK